MKQNVKQTLFPLWDEQIAVRRRSVGDNGLHVTTQMRGGLCLTESQCENSGGEWKWASDGGYYCDGSDCSDSGTGDWD
jgi:hypothetical protein